jgi:non-canonical purine NTP pyrophosphatase (RdgB/HAM1 family)
MACFRASLSTGIPLGCQRAEWLFRCGGRVAANQKVLVIASGNPLKVAEIKEMLAPVNLEVRQQPDGLEIAETGSTYLENARLKASVVARISKNWALADDSGLEVDALGGAPGIFSARYAASDKQRIDRLLKELKGTLYRSAGFHSAVALADPNGTIQLEAEGICRGEILLEPRGEGFGYDPVFWLRAANSTYGQMAAHQKLKFGSRGKAVRAIAAEMSFLLGL